MGCDEWGADGLGSSSGVSVMTADSSHELSHVANLFPEFFTSEARLVWCITSRDCVIVSPKEGTG
jgi:hypothetical protein